MWQLYRKWKLIIPAVAPREEVLTSCRPTAPPHQYQARAKLLRSTVRMGAFAWPQQLGPVCFPVTSEQHVPFSPPSVWVIQHTQVSWSCRVCACPGDSLSLILVVWKCTLGHITNTPGLPGEQCAATPQNKPCASDQGLWWDMTTAWHLTQPTPSLFTQDYRPVRPFLGAMLILAMREKYFWSCDGKGTARSLRKSDRARWTCQTCQTLSAGHRMISQLRILYNNFPRATYLNENPWELLS